MASIGNVAFSGASSGLDFGAVIDALTALQKRSVQTLQNRVTTQTAKQAAYLDLSSALLGIQTAASPLADGALFGRTAAHSSNESVLVTSSNGGVAGSYVFDVKRLAQSQQLRSGGFASAGATVGQSGELSIEIGGQGLTRNTPLESLRGGAGVDRGTVLLRQTVGATTTVASVDLRAASGVQDVVDAFNSSGVPMTARVEGDRVLLTYAGTGSLEVLNGTGDTTASDLGLTGTLAAGETRFGANVNVVTAATKLAALNEGAGVRQAAGADFVVTATDGTGYSVDLAGATTVGDAIAAINSATGGAVTASLNAQGNALELKDTAGGPANLTVTASPGSNAARDLGLLVASEAAGDPAALAPHDFLSGERLIPDLNGLLVRSLNGGTSDFYPDGTAPASNDIQGVAGGTISIADTLGGTTSVDLAKRFRTDVTGIVSADTLTISAGADIRAGQVLRLTDGAVNEYAVVKSTTAAGGGAFDVTFTAPVTAGIGAGAFRSRETVGSVVAEINRAGSGLFEASVNSSGNGLQLRDLAGGAGALAVSEGGSTTARDLGLINASLAGAVDATSVTSAEFIGLDAAAFVNQPLTITSGAATGFTATVTAFDSATGKLTLSADPAAAGALAGDSFRLGGDPAHVTGADTNPALLTDNSLLSSLNGGRGVQPGKIRITDRTGAAFTVDLSQSTDKTVFDVVSQVNAAASTVGSSLRARINDTGDGILLTQAAGAGALRVDEVAGGRTARDLRLLGTASVSTPGQLNGSFQVRLAIASGDTLGAVVTRINALGIPVSAAAVSDGSLSSPFRLSLIATQSGDRGRVLVDTNVGSLTFGSVAPAHDALVLAGAGSATALIQSSTNTVTGAAPGLTLDLRGTGGPVSVTVTPDGGAVKDAVKALAAAFNQAAGTINKLGAFDTTTNVAGPLFGDPTLRAADRALFDLFNRPVNGLPSGTIRDFAAVGLKLGKDGRFSVDEPTLDAALASTPDQVRDFFAASRSVALDTKLADFRNGLGIERATSGDDFKVTLHDGSSVSVSLAGVTSVSQLLDRVNSDPENTGSLVASIAPDGHSLQFSDSTSGPASFRVDPVGSSAAAAQLGLQKAVDGSPLLVSTPADLTRDPGAARRAVEGLESLVTSPEGQISRKTQGIEKTISTLNDGIEAANKRVQDTIDRLTRRFAALEDFLSQNNSTLNLLKATLAPLGQQGGSK
ncbi:MAG: flagellar filament capping protein FliD [Planctomycetes bacterium]|nr:flagellar filament capping protein FliD [Planctomycetota bacterium]